MPFETMFNGSCRLEPNFKLCARKTKGGDVFIAITELKEEKARTNAVILTPETAYELSLALDYMVNEAEANDDA